MVWRLAQESDLQEVEDLLRRHVQSSMFLLGNLLDHGLGSDSRHGLTLWVRETGGGVFAITNSGMVLMQAPVATSADWRAAAQLIGARPIAGASGDAVQLRAFLDASVLSGRPARMDEDEPGFRLDLDNLVMPDNPAGFDFALRPLADAPREQMVGWRSAYLLEVLGTPADEAARTAKADIDHYLSRDSHRVLFADGEPVAMTGFNAEVPGVVQVGGVYTPPDLRGRGYARRAVALHLADARAQGFEQAVLFAASDAAARAYQAIGFHPAGAYALLLFATAQTLCESAQQQETS